MMPTAELIGATKAVSGATKAHESCLTHQRNQHQRIARFLIQISCSRRIQRYMMIHVLFSSSRTRRRILHVCEGDLISFSGDLPDSEFFLPSPRCGPLSEYLRNLIAHPSNSRAGPTTGTRTRCTSRHKLAYVGTWFPRSLQASNSWIRKEGVSFLPTYLVLVLHSFF